MVWTSGPFEDNFVIRKKIFEGDLFVLHVQIITLEFEKKCQIFERELFVVGREGSRQCYMLPTGIGRQK